MEAVFKAEASRRDLPIRHGQRARYLLFFSDMKATVFAALACLFFSLPACTGETVSKSSANSPAAKPPGTREPVLVELYTSEGCSNCPPADAQLAFLETTQPVQGAEVITLGFHVDYFDQRGWKDENASPSSTHRQNGYVKRMNLDSAYTPQMIVDGKMQFVGSDARRANEAITQAAMPVKGKADLLVKDAGVEIHFENIPKHDAGTVYLAVAEDKIVTKVKAGGNSGKTLSHISVVRAFGEIGTLTADQSTFEAAVNEIKFDTKWKKENLKYVAFVQENTSGRVIAAGRVKAK